MDPLDPERRYNKQATGAQLGPLFATPPSANTGRKAARLDVTGAQIESDKVRIRRAIDEAKERGLTRSEIATATGIAKDTVNRRLGHDLLPQPSDYVQPFMRGTERVVVNASIWARYVATSPEYVECHKSRGGA